MVSKKEFQQLLTRASAKDALHADVLVAIDPDIERSGVAELHRSSRKIKLFSLRFPELMDYLLSAKRYSEVGQFRLGVIVEAGWLNKGNWHLTGQDTKYSAAEKGRQTGRNHETGRKIVEMCNHFQIITEEVKPLRKLWLGKDRKITAAEFNQITGYTGRSSQDMRDAGLLAWICAGLPIRVN